LDYLSAKKNRTARTPVDTARREDAFKTLRTKYRRHPEQFARSFYTQRKKGIIGFYGGDSGKTAYFAVQIEIGGNKAMGLSSALIP
jgi:hypothetical protein